MKPKNPNQITPYQKSSKLVNIVKECKLIEIPDEAIKNVIEMDTGVRPTNEQLNDLIETARREVREEHIEIDIHMDEMIKYGLYKDNMRQQSMLTRLEQIVYTMILEEAVKPGDMKNRNLILAMNNSLIKVFGAKNQNATNITFLGRTKQLLEERLQGNDTEINRKTSIMVKGKKEDMEKLISEAVDIKEIQRNRVA